MHLHLQGRGLGRQQRGWHGGHGGGHGGLHSGGLHSGGGQGLQGLQGRGVQRQGRDVQQQGRLVEQQLLGGVNKQLPMQLSTFSPQQTPLPKPPTMQFTPLQISLTPLSWQQGEQQRDEQHEREHIKTSPS